MQMYGVNDPNHQLLAVGYEPTGGILRCRWSKGWGEHSGVPEKVFVLIRRVPYAYGYYQKSVKGRYPYKKIEASDVQTNLPNDTPRRDSDTDYGLPASTASIGIQGPDLPASMRHIVPMGRFNAGSAGGQVKPFPQCPHCSSYALYRENNIGDYECMTCGKCGITEEDARNTKKGFTVEIYRPEDGMAFIEKDPKTGEACHYYTLKGERIPFSLTQILEQSGLARQPGSAAEAEMWAKKAVLGTKVHEYTLWLDQGEIELEDLAKYPSYYNRVLGWTQFRDDFKFMPDLTLCEVPIGVRVNGMLYATKVDAYGVIGDESNLAMAVVEKKCSANIEPHYALQTAGEAIPFKDQAASVGMPLKRFLVQLLEDKNGAGKYYNVREYTDRNDEKVFVGAGLMNCYSRLQYGTLKVAA